MPRNSNSSPVAKVSSIPDILFNGSKIKGNGSKKKKEKDGLNSLRNSLDISRISNEFHGDDSKDDNDETFNDSADYSADFEPLKFKMNRTPEPPSNTADTPQEYLDSLEQIRQQIQKVTNGTITTQRPINANMIPWSFGDIDKEQFEEYLEKPHYIRCLPRKVDLKLFNRLFLAQELKDNSNEPELSYDTARTNTSHKTRNRGRGSVSSTASNSDGLKKAIWKTQFSLDGKYMAVGSKDGTIKILKVISSPVERWEMDNLDESNKMSRAKKMLRMKQLAASSTFSKLNSGDVETDISELQNNLHEDSESTNLFAPVFHPTPFKIFKEHTFDVLDLDWSKNNFLLTASMDKTVKLWHLDRRESLRTFQHPDFVTGVKFHPTDDRFFVTGCLDHKVRLWSIIDNEVSYEHDCQDLITSIEIMKDDGKYTIIGTFNGFIHILLTKGLKPVLSFHVSNKEIKWTDSDFMTMTKHTNGPRITGIQIISGSYEPLKLLVTSNDSRIRVFDIEKKKMVEFLKGFQSGSSQHQAFYLENGGESTVLCSSDDHWLYGWNLRSNDESDSNKGRSHSVSTIDTGHDSHQDLSSTSSAGSLDYNNELKDHDENGKLMVPQSGVANTTPNKKKRRKRDKIFDSLRNIAHSHHRSRHSTIKNSRYSCFHAHHFPVTTSLVAPVDTSKILSLSNDFICELTLDTMRDNQASDDNPYIESSAGATSNVVKAIGTILITTDNQGTIRVFRTDIPTEIRNKVMNDLKEYETANTTNTRALETHSSMNCFPHSRIDSSATIKNNSSHGLPVPPGVSEINDMTPRSSTEQLPTGERDILKTPNGHVINNVRPTGGPNLIYKNPKNDLSTSSIGKVIATSSSARRHAKSTNSTNSNENETGSGRNIVANLSALSLRCNVCNGTNFTQYSNNMGLQRDNNYSCVDCGTTLNNFR